MPFGSALGQALLIKPRSILWLDAIQDAGLNYTHYHRMVESTWSRTVAKGYLSHNNIRSQLPLKPDYSSAQSGDYPGR